MSDEGKTRPKSLEGKISVYDMWSRPPKGRLVIVEPNDDIARMLEVRLARDGHEVVTASTGEAALELVEDEPLDVALIDRGLTDIDCLDLLAQMKQLLDPFEVIVLTTDPTTEIAVEALEHGAYDIVGKPFSNLKIVTSKVENAVGKVRAERDRAELARVLYEQTQDLAEREVEAEQSKSGDLPALSDETEPDGLDYESMTGLDPLTGIPNRAAAEQRFRTETARALRYDRPLCIALASIDGLANVIQTHGGAVGDGILRGVVQLFQGMVRDVDFIARQQGGEFFFIFPETPKENCGIVVDRIRQKLAQTSFSDFVGAGAEDIHLTVCFGVAGLPADTMNVEILKKAGEAALSRAKRTGDAVVEFEPDMLARG